MFPSSSELPFSRRLPPTVYPPGTMIGPYLVHGLLGEGGESRVYQAQAPGGGVHALKVSRYDVRALPADARERLVRRLEREFSTLRLFPHRYLVPVHTFGVCAEFGTPYIGMELLFGETLEDFLKERPPSLRVRMELFRKVVEAVAHLHAHGLVHRDLKPSNIYVRDNGDPAVLDFGIVSAPWLDTITGERVVLGTRAYMSPEALAHPGREHYRPKPADDVYALGVLLYRLLTGMLPHDSPAQAKHQRSAPDHPCELAPQTPRRLGDFAMRLLAKRPHQRPPDARAMREELGELLKAVPLAPGASEITEPMEVPAPPRTRLGRALPWLAALAVLAVAPWALWTFSFSGHHAAPHAVVTSEAPPVVEAPAPAPTVPTAAPPLPSPKPQPQEKASLSVPKSSHTARAPKRIVPKLCLLAAGISVAEPACVSAPVAQGDQGFFDDCPKEARQTRKDLDLSPNKYYSGWLEAWDGMDRSDRTPLFIRNGRVVARVEWRGKTSREREVLEGALLYGQARLGEDRISIRFNQIQIKGEARPRPICAVAFTFDGERLGPGLHSFPAPGFAEPSQRELERAMAHGPDELPFGTDHFSFVVR